MDAKTAAKIRPERDAMLGAGLGKPEEGIAAIASCIAAGSGTDLAASDLVLDLIALVALEA